MQREKLQFQVEDDTAEVLVVKTVTNKIFSLDRCDHHVTTGMCLFRVIDRGKIGARLQSLRAHVQMEQHPEFHLDCVYMEEQPKIVSRGCADSRRVSR